MSPSPSSGEGKMWVVAGTWSGPKSGMFSGTHRVSPKMVVADNPDEAIREVVRQCDCLSLECGISFVVWPVGDPLDTTYEAKYDGPAFDGHGRATPGVKLRVRKFTQHETELEV